MNGLYGDIGIKYPRRVMDEVDASLGKLGKTTYEAHPTYTDPYTNP